MKRGTSSESGAAGALSSERLALWNYSRPSAGPAPSPSVPRLAGSCCRFLLLAGVAVVTGSSENSRTSVHHICMKFRDASPFK